QLREEADEQRIVHRLAYRALSAAVDIHHVGHALEDVEADAEREYDLQEERVRGPPQDQRHIGRQEIVVLEEAQKPEVGGQAENQHRLAPRPGSNPLQPQARAIVDHRQRQQQEDKLGVPTGIEVVAGGQQDVLARGPRGGIEEDQHHGQKQEELGGVKQHGASLQDRKS